MLSEKYKKIFLKKRTSKYDGESCISAAIVKEEDFKIELLNWTKNHVDEYLKSFNSSSSNSLYKYTLVLKKFIEFICNSEALPMPELSVFSRSIEELEEFIDIEKLLSITLNYDQYLKIKNQLIATRDRLIFELPWSGLTNEEVKLLKETDIEFIESDDNENIILLHLKDRVVRIEDLDIIKDIKQCLNERYYTVYASDGREKSMSFKDSEYLIKAVQVGRGKKETYLDNPALTLHNIFLKNDIQCDGIDMTSLSMEDIRRSKVIYLLAPENQEYFDEDTIAGLFNYSNKSNMKWLKSIAELKYKN